MSEVRLIDANALLEKMRSYDIQGETLSIARNWAICQVMDAPTIEPPTKCIAQVNVDMDKVVERVMERIKMEYEKSE